MNVDDPFYTGALPDVITFAVGLAIVLLVGWAVDKVKKR